MRANGIHPYKTLAGGVGINSAGSRTQASEEATTLALPQAGSARDAALAQGRAVLIYLKHRGVLNVEEFRRTKPRGL